ncbi:hypothetical protein [Chryseobacterium sp.]|uniref:hypothetical protein n=1 Tax=Chryseobacterium sp. TaxID=1871047 RepID=UPI000EBC75E6|nr:hypothetical protein [Chryseobacterium sp.]HCM34128.1 hypothetical protein [Chryseobacterium sp.]
MNKKQQGQNFLDLIIQQSGSFDEVINAAVLNDMSLTDNIAIGTEIKNKNIQDEDNVNLFNQNNKPATALRNTDEDLSSQDGIGYWIIEETFIVS